MAVGDLTPIALIGYRNEIQRNQNKAASTVNAHVAAIRSWCTWLQEAGYISSNPSTHLKFVASQGITSAKGLKDKQINALLRKAQRTRYPERDYAILQMLLQTGIRIGECAALNYQDSVLSERGGNVTIRGGKGNKARIVPLNGSMRKAIIDYAAHTLKAGATLDSVLALWPSRQLDQPIPLWYSQKTGRLSASAIQRMIDNLVRDCSAA